MRIIIELPGVSEPGIQIQRSEATDGGRSPGRESPTETGQELAGASEASLDAGPAPVEAVGGEAGASEGETIQPSGGGSPTIDAGAGPTLEERESAGAGSVLENLEPRFEGGDGLG